MTSKSVEPVDPVAAGLEAAGRPARRVRRAVQRGLRHWPAAPAPMRLKRGAAGEWPGLALGLGADPQVVGPMPQRERLLTPVTPTTEADDLEPPQFRAGRWQAFGRLGRWLFLILSVVLGDLLDRLRKRDTLERRAARLRRGLERVGGTFVKIGQQVAMRIDLVPWEYGVELSKMLDQMPPFPVEYALKTIEATTGKPWDEIFAVFDPHPVGSASIACVFQAVLRDGTKVAVKIRRPGIGELFRADFKVMDWIFDAVEFLTIVRPGFTRNLRREFQETLLEELDFRREARFQDIFRRASAKCGKDFLTAPQVFFEYTGEAMLVQEFVSGMWLWEVMAAVEHNDPDGLALMRQLDIDPRRVARRIMWSAFWSMDENLFFHADPHPANIVVGPGGTLVFIDFGSCGSFNDEQRVALEAVVLALQARDVSGMARAILKLLEPFPPIDLGALIREAEAEAVRVLYTFEVKPEYTEWWERTSAKQWIAMIRVARAYNLAMNLHTLRMIRATLLYDTLVLRLDGTLNRYAEYARFMDDRARFSRQRWLRRIAANSGDNFFVRVEELTETGQEVFRRAQHLVSSPVLHFASVVDKWAFTLSVLARMAVRLSFFTLVCALAVSLAALIQGRPTDMLLTFRTVFQHWFYLGTALVIVILNLRHILFRLRERDTKT
ncbi:MAG: AarF/ABC1/UbiB kinase family protein [Anaerolineales bacterium]|nr:AarF/ABC1/UbiB kinase family protein [Anaerolineales bacterium]